MKKVLVTGSAGFIGFHLSLELARLGFIVHGIDSLNDYYDVRLKFDRLERLGIRKSLIKQNKKIQSEEFNNYYFSCIDITQHKVIFNLFLSESYDYVVNLAAQAGVRYSIENPRAYIDSNVTGFLNILEASKYSNIEHLVYASSSSVYGLSTASPFSESDPTDYPISIYAASKKSNELMAHTYSHLYNMPTTGLRFFTVYGPYGRPDMALFSFANAIMNDEPIKLFNYGNMIRDFTYIDDIVHAIVLLLNKPPQVKNIKNLENSNDLSAPFKIFNIGNSDPRNLSEYLDLLEKSLNQKSKRILVGMQPGDVLKTYADTSQLMAEIGFIPKTPIDVGIKLFSEWYLENYFEKYS